MVLQATSREKLSLLILICAATLAFSIPFAARLRGGNPMDFILLDVNGKKVRLGELAEDKPLLLYFWATWCKPCHLTQPKVASLANKYRGRITVLGINVGRVDSLKDINKYRKRYKISYPLLIDSDDDTSRAYSIDAIPTIILLDETGKILFRDNKTPANLEELLPR